MANLEEKAGQGGGALLRTDHPAICYLFPRNTRTVTYGSSTTVSKPLAEHMDQCSPAGAFPPS